MPELTLEELFGRLEVDAEETISDIDTRKQTAEHVAKEVRTFGSALTEHERTLRNSIKTISQHLERGSKQISKQLLIKARRETGPGEDTCGSILHSMDSIHRNARLLEERIRENLEQMSLRKGEEQRRILD